MRLTQKTGFASSFIPSRQRVTLFNVFRQVRLNLSANITMTFTQAPCIVWRDTARPEDYEKARTSRLFNGVVPKRYPAGILFAKTEHDIVHAMKVAIERNIRVSVRAGGQSYPAWSVRDDALLLDLGEFSELVLDQKTHIVRLSPSTTGRELDKYLVANSRAFPGGHCPDVAVGGYLLGGGMGWNTNVSCLLLAKQRKSSTDQGQELGLGV